MQEFTFFEKLFFRIQKPPLPFKFRKLKLRIENTLDGNTSTIRKRNMKKKIALTGHMA